MISFMNSYCSHMIGNYVRMASEPALPGARALGPAAASAPPSPPCSRPRADARPAFQNAVPASPPGGCRLTPEASSAFRKKSRRNFDVAVGWGAGAVSPAFANGWARGSGFRRWGTIR